MKSSVSVPRGAVDLSDFAAVTGDGPYLSAYIPTDSAVENAAQKSEAHWKAFRRTLADAGAPEAALDCVDPLVADAHLSGETLAVIADAERVLLVEHLPDTIALPRGSWGPVADLVPIIKARQERIAFVTVWADHGGADITAYHASGKTREETVGDGEPLRKTAPGGWSQQRYQQRAENDWSDNAADVAQHVTRLAAKVGARITIIGGEARSIHMVAEQLPRDFPVALIEYGRATDGSEQMRDDAVRTQVRTAVAEDTVAILEKWKEEHGQRDRATQGITDTAGALQRAAVDVLLVPDNRDLLAEDAGVVDTLVRDAIRTGASVRVIPSAGPVQGGVGAILRFV